MSTTSTPPTTTSIQTAATAAKTKSANRPRRVVVTLLSSESDETEGEGEGEGKDGDHTSKGKGEGGDYDTREGEDVGACSNSSSGGGGGEYGAGTIGESSGAQEAERGIFKCVDGESDCDSDDDRAFVDIRGDERTMATGDTTKTMNSTKSEEPETEMAVRRVRRKISGHLSTGAGAVTEARWTVEAGLHEPKAQV